MISNNSQSKFLKTFHTILRMLTKITINIKIWLVFYDRQYWLQFFIFGHNHYLSFLNLIFLQFFQIIISFFLFDYFNMFSQITDHNVNLFRMQFIVLNNIRFKEYFLSLKIILPIISHHLFFILKSSSFKQSFYSWFRIKFQCIPM